MTMERPRRVLMLCYFFPPVQTVAIARNAGFARELPSHGWRPTVLTPEIARDSWSVVGRSAPVPEDVEVVRTPELNLDRLLSLFDGVTSRTLKGWMGRWRGHWFRDLCVPDPQHGWRVRRRGAQLARDCDCIYASCSPFSSALAAVAIKRRTGRPLVLDFRDPWTLNPQAPDHLPLHRWLARRMERACIRAADRVILNTESTFEAYRAYYPQWADRFTWIPNGFDGLNEPDVASAADNGPFTIVHAGSIYHERNPEPLLKALVELDLPGLRFVQVGPDHACFDAYRGRLDIHVTGQVPPAQAAEWMRSASLLYLALGRDPNHPPVSVTAKTYEYLATGLPVLADCPPGDNARMVERYASYPYVITEPDQEAFKAAVRDAYEQRGHRQPAVDPEYARHFNRSALAGRLAAELEAACGAANAERGTGRVAESVEAGDAR